MPDYGHDLRFGVFITPVAEQFDTVLQLAELADVEGLDLVTFQDHPYQRNFLETWTLLTAVAARTRSITVGPNVLNVPLRLPAMIGKSAQTLDALSRGRLLLGLGAGAFWDGIARMGGPRLAGGESVDALSDAVDVIRTQWRGPIAIGAYQRRMLTLTGSKADAWLPSLGYLEPEDFAAANATVDGAARAVGREPRDVRRILNIAPNSLPEDRAAWPGLLAHWTVAYGFSTYILATDDVDTLTSWANELAPAVRDRVDDHRRATDSGADGEPTANAIPTAAATPSRVASRGSAVAEVDSPRLDGPPTAEAVDVVAQYARLGVQPTPTDVVSTAWDESERPHRRPTTAETRYSDTGRAVGAHLIEVHDVLRQDLNEVLSVVDQVRQGVLDAAVARAELNATALRQNNWTMGAMCARYCTFVANHHGLEDNAIFPHLRQTEPDLVPVIDRLQHEHEVIHDALELVDQALVSHLRTPDDFEPLQAAVDRLREMLLSHLSYEETELVEPLARLGFFAGQLPSVR